MKTLLKNGTLIDGNGRVIENASVLFDSRIRSVAIGKDEPTRLDDETHVVELDGATILPGLINLHIHAARRHLSRQAEGQPFRQSAPKIEAQDDEVRFAWAVKNCWEELQEGVTTFRDTGSRNALANRLRWAFEAGIIRGPRVVSCGEAIAITGGYGTQYKNFATESADGPIGVQQAVREQLALGADWIKLMASSGLEGMPVEDPRRPGFTVEEMAAGVQAAHARNARVSAHAFFPREIQNAVRAGVDCIEHGQIIDEETAELMAKAGARYVPTTSGQTEIARRERQNGNAEVADDMDRTVVRPHAESIAIAHGAGVQIGTGTDTLGQMVTEIEMLHAAGLPKMDCLKAATSTAADILGLASEFGSIEEGKLADILVIEANPLDDLRALEGVKFVFVKGNQVTPSWLVGTIEDAMQQSMLSPTKPFYRTGV